MKRKRSKIPPRKLRELWEQVPSIDCKGLCSNSCGPIDTSATERELIEGRAGKKLEAPNLDCSMLKNGRCMVYSIRPMICRLWGVVESMPCPHGCKPERTLTDREGFALLAESMRVGGDPKDADEMLVGMKRITEDPELHAAFKKWIGSRKDFGGNVMERVASNNEMVEVMKRKGYG